jgi:hypothetical protein
MRGRKPTSRYLSRKRNFRVLTIRYPAYMFPIRMLPVIAAPTATYVLAVVHCGVARRKSNARPDYFVSIGIVVVVVAPMVPTRMPIMLMRPDEGTANCTIPRVFAVFGYAVFSMIVCCACPARAIVVGYTEISGGGG